MNFCSLLESFQEASHSMHGVSLSTLSENLQWGPQEGRSKDTGWFESRDRMSPGTNPRSSCLQLWPFTWLARAFCTEALCKYAVEICPQVLWKWEQCPESQVWVRISWGAELLILQTSACPQLQVNSWDHQSQRWEELSVGDDYN